MSSPTQSYIEFYILIHANLFCAEYQIKTIRAFCKDPYKILIVDSNCGEYPELSAKLTELCKKEGVEPIKLPKQLALKGTDISTILSLFIC